MTPMPNHRKRPIHRSPISSVGEALRRATRLKSRIFSLRRSVLIPAALVIVAAASYSSVVLVPSSAPDEVAIPGNSWFQDQIVRLPARSLECALDPADIPPSQNGPNGKRPNYFHTCGSAILDSYGREFRVVGLSWSGMEYNDHAPLGLHTRNWSDMLDQIASLSYNTLRLPYTNDMLEPGVAPNSIDYDINPDLRGLSALEVLDRLVEGARQRGLRVILDRHRPTAVDQSPLWYTYEIPEDRWISDWQMLSRRYLGNDTVIGADLHNEPKWEATWGSGDRDTDWALAAERAGNAIHAINPYLLIFAQGIDRQGEDLYWWGGDLRGVARKRVQLSIPNRVVYSPRDYGTQVSFQGYFMDPRFPDNLPEVWDDHWGFIQKQQIAPIVLGEIGGTRLDDSLDGRWTRALLNYLEANKIGYVNWALDRSAFDDPAALAANTATVILDQSRLYRASIGIADSQVEASSNPSATSLRVLYRATNPTEKTDAIGFAVKVRNSGTAAVDLARIEMRYWFTAGPSPAQTQNVLATGVGSGGGQVHPEIVPSSSNGLNYYLRLAFVELAGTIPPFSDSQEILVDLRKKDRSSYLQTNDFSFAPNTDYQESDRIALYLDGQLIWGIEP